jgi:hypothetical protein
MKKIKEEKIEMMRLENRRGAVLLKTQYEVIADFILDALKANSEHEIALNELLEIAHPKLDAQFHGDVSWFLLQVKQDLEARRIITTMLTRNREQIIRLKNLNSEAVHKRSKYYPAFS